MKNVVNALTFLELVEHGRQQVNPSDLVNGYPWSFEYGDHPITHENDSCYIVESEGASMKMTPEDVLLLFHDGTIAPCNKYLFEKISESAK